MIFSKVPLNIQVQIQKLVGDQQFQDRFANDEILDQLDQLKYDPFIQYNQLQLLFHNKIKLYGKEFNPITLGLWGFLYTIKSPLIFLQKTCTTVDINLFFYLLETKNFTDPIDVLIAKSSHWAKENLNLSLQQIKEALQKIVKVNFRVLNMFPKYKIENNVPVFNVDWITSIASKVVQVSSYTTQQVYNQISVCQAFYLFAQYCREQGNEAIFLRTEEEIMQQQDLRATTLLVERLIELKVIDQDDKQFYINIIHNQEKE